MWGRIWVCTWASDQKKCVFLPCFPTNLLISVIIYNFAGSFALNSTHCQWRESLLIHCATCVIFQPLYAGEETLCGTWCYWYDSKSFNNTVEQWKNISLPIMPHPNTKFNSTIWTTFYVAVLKNISLWKQHLNIYVIKLGCHLNFLVIYNSFHNVWNCNQHFIIVFFFKSLLYFSNQTANSRIVDHHFVVFIDVMNVTPSSPSSRRRGTRLLRGRAASLNLQEVSSSSSTLRICEQIKSAFFLSSKIYHTGVTSMLRSMSKTKPATSNCHGTLTP